MNYVLLRIVCSYCTVHIVNNIINQLFVYKIVLLYFEPILTKKNQRKRLKKKFISSKLKKFVVISC